VKLGLLGSGKCWKKDGWVVSIYKRVGDRYNTVKLKKLRKPELKKRQTAG
jgi:hypothetical protein